MHLTASPTTWSQLAVADTISFSIGNRADTIRRAGTIRGNTVCLLTVSKAPLLIVRGERQERCGECVVLLVPLTLMLITLATGLAARENKPGEPGRERD